MKARDAANAYGENGVRRGSVIVMTQWGVSVVLRRDRAHNAISRLERDVSDWLQAWDSESPQTSQIKRCGALLKGLVTRLGSQAAELPADDHAFAACRLLDNDTAVIERLFRLYKERFEQRRSPGLPLSDTLKAVDELIWSCMQQATPLAGEVMPPLPLAYVEPAFSPSATPRTRPPTALPVRDRQLAEALRILPIPLIGLPLAIVEEPWWMVLVSHEVGHHLQYDLDPDLVKQTGVALAEAAGDPGWELWRNEVFADAVSVMALGPTALAAVAEIEWDNAAGLGAPRDLYPPVIVRLALMAELARYLGYKDTPFGCDAWPATVASLIDADRDRVVEQLARVPAAAAALWSLKVARGSLAELSDLASPAVVGGEGVSGSLAVRRLQGNNVSLARGRGEPRRTAVLAFEAYRSLAPCGDTERTNQQRELARNTIAAIQEAGDPKTRRAVGTTAPTQPIIDRVFDSFREVQQATPEQA